MKKVLNIERSIGIVTVLLCAVVIPLLFILTYKHRNTVEFNKTVTILFEDFKCERYMTMIYYPLFFLRRLLYISGIVFLSDYPLLQVILTSTFSFVFVAYVFVFKPFNSIQKLILNCVNEMFLFVVFVVTGLSLLDLSEDRVVMIAIIFSLGTMVLVLGNFILMVWLGVNKLKEKCKKDDSEEHGAEEKGNVEEGRGEVENDNENYNMADVTNMLRVESI